MTLLRLLGTVLWACILLAFGALAPSTGEGWAWIVFFVCLGVFVALAYATQRPRQSAS
jgi:hypothetical protein